jgi:hypothetical protein
VADVHVQGLRELFRGDAPFDGATDHEVLLNTGETIDPVVVGVAFVIGGHQAGSLVEAQLFQRDQSCVSVQQDVLPLAVGLAHRQGFDQPDRLDGCGDLLEFP